MNSPGIISLPKSIKAWKTPAFKEVAREEIGQLDPKLFPLQQCLTQGSYANEENISIVILNVNESADAIHLKAGIFYTSVLAGCNCADDPSPVDELTEYCEIELAIDIKTSRTTISNPKCL